nr:MptD family putative ECF transporter S component [Streptococcus gallolyticus]
MVLYDLFIGIRFYDDSDLYYTCDAYIQRLIDQGYGQAYADKMMSVLPNWTFLPVLLLGAIGGYLGATIGIKMLQKHFKKLGMA